MQSTQPMDNWQLGDAYERYVGRWSRRVAPSFLEWLDAPAGARWLDIGCGTGALSSAIIECCRPASLTGVEPSDGFLKVARAALADHVILRSGDAASIPLPDAAVDVAVSGLVLNFVPDLNAAMQEVTRVTRKGGTFGAYVWDYAGKMELMRYFWDAAVALDPGAEKLDEGRRFPLCQPDALAACVKSAGLVQAEVTAIDIPTTFASFQDYWEPFLGGQGPAPAYAMSLNEAARSELKDRLRDTMPIAADGSISLVARAWAVRAVVDGAASVV
jgi:SAM-dependent methyltransferase